MRPQLANAVDVRAFRPHVVNGDLDAVGFEIQEQVVKCIEIIVEVVFGNFKDNAFERKPAFPVLEQGLEEIFTVPCHQLACVAVDEQQAVLIFEQQLIQRHLEQPLVHFGFELVRNFRVVEEIAE